MKILHTLPRHAPHLTRLVNQVGMGDMTDYKYIVICIDGPESVNRQASWASSFNGEDTHKILAALADQTKP